VRKRGGKASFQRRGKARRVPFYGKIVSSLKKQGENGITRSKRVPEKLFETGGGGMSTMSHSPSKKKEKVRGQGPTGPHVKEKPAIASKERASGPQKGKNVPMLTGKKPKGKWRRREETDQKRPSEARPAFGLKEMGDLKTYKQGKKNKDERSQKEVNLCR